MQMKDKTSHQRLKQGSGLKRFTLEKVLRCLTGLGVALAPVTARAEVPLGNGFALDSGFRVRHEQVDWFGPAGADTDYGFTHVKEQLGISYTHDWFKAYAQGQAFGVFGLPQFAVGPGGGFIAANNGDTTPTSVGIRQLYATLRNPQLPFSLQAGRFFYSNGAELAHKDKHLAALRGMRIEQRLIGPFEYNIGRSFDGARLDVPVGTDASLTFFGAHPTQGGMETNFAQEINQVDLASAVVSHHTDSSDFQGFYYYFGDDRDVVKVDDRPLAIRTLDLQDISIHSFGAHLIHLIKMQGGTIDLVAWGVYQTGEWGALDHSGYSYIAEAGYQFTDVPGTPWIRAGYNYGSGDNNPGDGNHDTFFQMLPTARAYARTPFFDMQNMEDIFAQVLVNPMQNLRIRGEFHVLNLAEGKDLFYAGGGAAERRTRFGYVGTPTGNSTDVGEFVDLEVAYDFDPHTTLTLYYGHLFGGDAPAKMFPGGDRDVDYGFAEIMWKL